MAGVVTTQTQKVEVTEVSDVIVTDIEQDEAEGTFVREIRVMTMTEDEDQPTQTFVLRLISGVRDNINVTSPATEF